MVKIEIELTDEQFDKVKQLEEQGISVGQSIDMLFEVRDETLSQIERIDEDMSLYEKLKDTAFDVDDKQKILNQQYGEPEKTYEMRIQDTKHKISWGRDFFNF